jgi:hypothetical protein
MPMLRFLRGNTSDRKLRLFAVACYRQVARWLTDGAAQEAFDLAERFADGAADRRDLLTLREQHQVVDDLSLPMPLLQPDWQGMQVAAAAAYWAVTRFPVDWAPPSPAKSSGPLCGILRCIFGNPFRPAAVDPAWLAWNDSVVRNLAEAAYQDRQLPSGRLNQARFAIIADALEEAGYMDTHLLGHLRDGGEHYRGCFAIDLLTGRC